MPRGLRSWCPGGGATAAEVAIFRFQFLSGPLLGFTLLPRLFLCLVHGATYRRADLRAALARLGLRLMGSLRHGCPHSSTAMPVTHAILAIRGVLPIPVSVAISISIPVPVAVAVAVALCFGGVLTAMPAAVATSRGIATAAAAVISATAAGVTTAAAAVAAS